MLDWCKHVADFAAVVARFEDSTAKKAAHRQAQMDHHVIIAMVNVNQGSWFKKPHHRGPGASVDFEYMTHWVHIVGDQCYFDVTLRWQGMEARSFQGVNNFYDIIVYI